MRKNNTNRYYELLLLEREHLSAGEDIMRGHRGLCIWEPLDRARFTTLRLHSGRSNRYIGMISERAAVHLVSYITGSKRYSMDHPQRADLKHCLSY